MNVISNQLRKVRRTRDVSQDELAKAIGTTRQTIIDIEKGHTQRPRDELMLSISNYFGLNVRDIFFTPPVQHVIQNEQHVTQEDPAKKEVS